MNLGAEKSFSPPPNRAILGLASVTLSQAVAPKALYEKAIALEVSKYLVKCVN